jgi:hypothetical protein
MSLCYLGQNPEDHCESFISHNNQTYMAVYSALIRTALYLEINEQKSTCEKFFIHIIYKTIPISFL